MSRKARTGARKRSNAIYIIPILIVVTGVVGYYIFTASGAGGGSPLIGKPVPQNVLNYLAGVSTSTLAQVGAGPSDIVAPTPTTSSSSLTVNGKPEVLYLGAEYCPYCAAERWAMIVAFDKFGNFSGIQYMQSSSTDVYPNTPTFTFVGATYTSNYVAFVTVEQLDRESVPLQTATAQETSLINTYDPGGGIPFVDFENQYTITSSQYLPSVLGSNGNWTLIASQLNTPSSPYAQSIDGAANKIISAICKIDGGAPASVCSQSFAQTLSYTRASPAGGSQLLVSDAVLSGPAPSGARFAPTRLTHWV